MRKSIIIDEKDLEIIIDARTNTSKPWLRRLAVFGFVIIAVGGILLTIGKAYGFGFMGAGFIILGIISMISSREKKKAKRYFKDYVEAHEELPPWLE